MNILFLLDWSLFLPITLIRIMIIYFYGSKYNINGLQFLDVMMHSNQKYFNQDCDSDPTIDTMNTDIRKVIKYDSYIYELKKTDQPINNSEPKQTDKNEVQVHNTKDIEMSENYALDTEIVENNTLGTEIVENSTEKINYKLDINAKEKLLSDSESDNTGSESQNSSCPESTSDSQFDSESKDNDFDDLSNSSSVIGNKYQNQNKKKNLSKLIKSAQRKISKMMMKN